MIEATPYPKEQQRLASLRGLNLLDTPIEERFERITRMVCKFMDVPIALFNLIDENRQHYKSVQGLNNVDASLKAAFCTHSLNEPDMLLIPNAHMDKRFFDNPFVTGEYLDIGFYAGCPIHTPDGMPIGTLCAIDTKPRDMTPEQLTIMRDLAAMVETELRAASLSKSQDSLREELNEAKHLALVDPLTRLWNRNGIMTLLDKELDVAARQKKPVTLVMGDIDHFKKINDTFGHPAGDAILKGVSKKLLECLRGEDAIGRIGGEEFLILLTDCKPDAVFETVDRIRQLLTREPFKMGQQTYGTSVVSQSYPVTMSFGTATVLPEPKMDSAALIKRADDALYQAKNNGRNQVSMAE